MVSVNALFCLARAAGGGVWYEWRRVIHCGPFIPDELRVHIITPAYSFNITFVALQSTCEPFIQGTYVYLVHTSTRFMYMSSATCCTKLFVYSNLVMVVCNYSMWDSWNHIITYIFHYKKHVVLTNIFTIYSISLCVNDLNCDADVWSVRTSMYIYIYSRYPQFYLWAKGYEISTYRFTDSIKLNE